MPQTKGQKVVFAILTVLITVHLFVFYNLSFVNGLSIEQVETYGVPIFGFPMGVWAVILIEIAFAFTLEMLVGSPCSLKLAFKVFDLRETKPILFETAIICATVCIMCPLMSFVAVFLYTDFMSMNFFEIMGTWFTLIFHNFPLALLSQLFFIQPCVRALFRKIKKNWR